MPNTWHVQHLLQSELTTTITAGSPGSSLLPSHLVVGFVTLTESQREAKEARPTGVAEFAGSGVEGFLFTGDAKKKASWRK